MGDGGGEAHADESGEGGEHIPLGPMGRGGGDGGDGEEKGDAGKDDADPVDDADKGHGVDVGVGAAGLDFFGRAVVGQRGGSHCEVSARGGDVIAGAGGADVDGVETVELELGDDCAEGCVDGSDQLAFHSNHGLVGSAFGRFLGRRRLTPAFVSEVGSHISCV